MQNQSSSHLFHIPVMGLAFTIDTPIKVAHFGISSAISIVQDNLIEKMRKHYYNHIGEPFIPIKNNEPDSRAQRIKDYLNLTKRIVDAKVEKLRSSEFGEGMEINQYFEMLPDHNPQKIDFELMCQLANGRQKQEIQDKLRQQIRAGSIDVNIMTKLDKSSYDSNGEEITDGSDAVTALRGYANSDLSNSTMVLSAGMNPRLFAYMEKLDVFDADSSGNFKKKIAIKVSDYRSALIQGKMLAKKGLWVSEFRIESGLNCGGHAFATEGFLLGPILEEFKNKRQELSDSLRAVYHESLREKGKVHGKQTPEIIITVQGGIGTNEERQLMSTYYQMNSTGWGTPFLLVPEATTVDEPTLKSIAMAKEKDVILSHNSPLGVRFHYLKGSSAEQLKFQKILDGKAGSPCTEKYLAFNTEFSTEPICTASLSYQKKKLAALEKENLSADEYRSRKMDILAKECLCIGLSNAAVHEYKLEPFKKRNETNICPGPNIAYFSEIVSLKTMVDHIYGRCNIMVGQRPHMFVKELSLYVDYWKELVADSKALLDNRHRKYVEKFHHNLIEGIGYYQELTEKLKNEFSELANSMQNKLTEAEETLNHYLELRLA